MMPGTRRLGDGADRGGQKKKPEARKKKAPGPAQDQPKSVQAIIVSVLLGVGGGVPHFARFLACFQAKIAKNRRACHIFSRNF